ncbi:hypothetical protein KSP39_PZI011820 [Platanthera zijinensis]|uniref:Uncharacterized protein n=1 Tax=Platanthera zijinensis TaxID=2320716 RepID=A0AAP0BFH4_9ASPA
MGCAASKFDDDEAVQLCRDRKNFIKQALDMRDRFASDHVAYIQSLERVSAALAHYVEADYRQDFFFDSYAAASLKKPRPEISGVALREQKQGKLGKATVRVVNHLRSGGNPPVSVEEEPESEESGSIGSHYYASQWDHPWNPFPSLDSYGYPSWTSIDRIIDDDDDDIAKLRKIREEEGIPELEEVNGDENRERTGNEKPKTERSHVGVQAGGESSADSSREFEKVWEAENESLESERIESSRTAGSRVYASMAEVMKDVEIQFMRICKSADGVSVLLETSTGRMLNQNASLRPTASDSSASRFGQDYLIPNSHRATLDRLNEWEKKLYEEVKAGERVRIAYEKHCKRLKSHDDNGEEPSVVEQTRAAIRDLYTQFNVYIHTVVSISKRIEALRDEELCPRLMELIKGLSRMWKIMADSHRIQKRTIDDAKLLVFAGAGVNPSKPSRGAAILADEIYNWRHCLGNWIRCMRSYAAALSSWASRCASAEFADGAKLPPAFRVCTRWSRLLDSMSEKQAVEGMEFFAAEMASVSEQQREAERAGLPPNEADDVALKVAEVGPKVICAGMSVAVGSMAVFAVAAAQGYDALGRRCWNEWREGRENSRNSRYNL